MTPWNKTRWAKHNVERGLSYYEICPGFTVGEHADSLAQFFLKDSPMAELQYMLAWAVLSDQIVEDLYNGYERPE